MRKFWNGFYLYPPDTGSGSGSAENGVAPGTDASVTSGSASESLIAAALASESSAGGAPGEESEAAKVAKMAGLDVETGTPKPGSSDAAAKPHATGGPGKVEPGQAPESRIESAVKNARATAVAETEAKYAWAKGIDQETVKTSFGLVEAMLTDTPKFLRTLAAQEGFQIVPIGEKPAVETGGAERKPFALPKAELRSEDGKGAYSEEQLGQILKDFAADLKAEFSGQLKPILSDRERAQKQADRDAEVHQASAIVTETMTELRAKPFFQVENKDGKKVDSPKIYEYLMAIPEKARQANPVAAMHRAYATYMEKDILPNFGAISAQRVRDENAKKAAGGGIRPNAGGGNGDTAPKPIRGVNELAASMERAYAAASSSS